MRSPLAVPAPEPTRSEPGKHIPALDGLRGLAVLLVVVFHIFQVEPAPSGSLPRLLYMATRLGQTGVDLFFVLSGFLITGILFDARGSARYFTNFYGRRTLRIFPLYYGVLVVTLVLLPRLFGVKSASDNPVWLWTYTTNLPIAFGADAGALPHFWTLAIEEQFYLIWPAVVFLAGRKALMRICLGCIAAALGARVIAEFTGISSFCFTPCRMDSLTLGSLLALAVRGPGGVGPCRKPAVAVVLGTMLVMAPLYLLKTGDGSHWVQVIKYTPTAAFYGAAMILAITSPARSWTARVLTSEPLRAVGRYSYGIYVYQAFAIHFAASALATDRLGPMGVSPVGALWIRVGSILALSFGAAWLSWHLYEKPFVAMKKYFEPGPAAPPSAIVERAPRRAEAALGMD